jgi:peptidyl-prolyl cis-trans isomerase A (cyclophilin A)
MTRLHTGFFSSAAITGLWLALNAALNLATASSVGATVVRFQTSSGNIDVRMYDSATPLSVANFLNYADSDRYDGTFVHRSVKSPTGVPFVIQGGGFVLHNSIFAATPIATDPPVLNEPGISNLRGTLALAKSTVPNSATSQWFFNVGNNSFLDLPANGAFTVFGRVVGSGMSVVDSINNLAIVNASAANNQPGENYNEVPVYDLAKAVSQQDIRNEDAVMVVDISALNLPAGDYNLDGAVNNADFAIWQADYGSTLRAEADGNGNGVVDDADYEIWRSGVPEPSTLAMAGMLSLFLPRRAARRGRSSSFRA